MLLLNNTLRRAMIAPAFIAGFAILSNGFCGDPVAAKAPMVAPQPPPPPFWDGSFHAGFGLTDGNTDTLNTNVGFRANHLGDDFEILLGTDFFYSEDTNVTTSESVYSFAQYNFLLTDRMYFGLVGDFLYDGITAVDYRVNVGPTLGYYIFKNDRTTLAVEVGAGYLWEDVGGVAADYWTVRFAERLTHQLTSMLSLFQSVSFVPAGDDWSNYILFAEAGIESRLSDRLSLRIFAQDRYDSQPAAGLAKNDFGVYSGFSFSLGAVDAMPADAAPAPAPSNWDVNFGLGFSATDGNSDTLGISADLLATQLNEFYEIYFGVGGGYGETNSVVNQERVSAFGQYNKLLSDRFYVGGRTDFLYDAVNALDYRVTPAALLGCYLVKSDTTTLAVEVGPSYTWEEQAGVASDYFGVYVGERFTHKMSDRIDIWQSAGAVLDIDDTDNIVVTADAGIDVKIGEHLAVRTAVRNIYDGVPSAGLEKNDFQVVSGLAWDF